MHPDITPPSVGRIVQYHGLNNRYAAAIVAADLGEGVVDLVVFYPQMTPVPVNHIGMGDGPGTWRWPPRVEDVKPRVGGEVKTPIHRTVEF